jgi:hypothetical protein
MTLAVSAQQKTLPGSNGLPSNDNSPFYAPRKAIPLTGYNNYWTNEDHRSRREENDLIRKSQDLVKQLAKAEGEKRENIKTELSETLGKQFDLRQKRHEAELKALEDQVKKLRDMVQKRQENRREIIGKRLETLVRESEGLGW